MINKQVKNSDLHGLKLSAWKHYIRRLIRVYTNTKMLKVGARSWWSRIKEEIPEGFADNFGRVREPWLTTLALLLQNRGLRISEYLNIQVDNVVPSVISAILAEGATGK